MNRYIRVRNRSGSVSLLLSKKTMVVMGSLLALCILMFITGLSIGSTMLHPAAVFRHLSGADKGEYDFIIGTLRLPRVILSLMVGGALAVSGLILQGIVRNPLASPDIIGITGGASVAAVIFITFFSETMGIRWLPVTAIAGAGAASLLVYVLAWKTGITPIRLVLIGIGISSACSALTTMIIVFSPTVKATQSYIWLTGSVYGASWEDIYGMLPWIGLFMPLALLLSRAAGVQELGDDVAVSLGARVQLHRFTLLCISVALAGAAVAYGGGIGFVGLIAPHISRKLAGRSFAALVPVAAMTGGLLVCGADVIARTAFLPLDIPAGVFTAGIGAPFFIYLLYRSRNS